MVAIVLKGVVKVTAKGRTYYYAWRGGPRLEGEPGSPEFLVSYQEAVEGSRAPDASRFRAVVTAYRASREYQGLAASTRRNWAPWLDRIDLYFGELRTAQFDRTEKIRPIIRRWRNGWAETPRTADYGMQVLSRVLSFGVDPLGALASNPCEGIKRLYSVDRSEIIWTEADLAQLARVAPPEVMHAVALAAHTGLRLGDLLRLSWSHVGDDAIVIATGKSKHRREAIVPLYDALRAVLAAIPKCSPVILTSSRARPWTENSFGTAFDRAKRRAEISDLHFHDLRGTAATRFYVAGLSIRIIAEVMAWEEATVEKIVRRYVGRTAATRAAIIALNESGPKR